MVEEVVAKLAVRPVQVGPFGPADDRNPFVLSPVNQVPEDLILEVQVEHDDAGVYGVNESAIFRKLEIDSLKIELHLQFALRLHPIARDSKFPTALLESPVQIIVNRHSVMGNLARNEQ